ncbi:Meiosis-specific protein HOP1 [Neolecta irregularis DAH-3]|uniref:Meiosis-specific protein HOP1 n=1 Tax=Neolecta irregularis (strain DAH-3) TaxID=1198029 RepID=A0A1U7LPH1_NEOID|nr:Meiosis-specific protein HOP1 [Neolecta irregularis DAH-3]|eukprot:OLL24421.1 Meiosis-specific protein HOP1 [Neolecta irregularis DAH-3]
MATIQLHRTQRQSVALSTIQSSLQLVESLLSASLGSITFLRGIFPESTFYDDRISDEDSESHRGRLSSNSASSTRVKKLKRGHSEEADQLLDYLEKGIYDAIYQKYLKSFILAIFLDPNRPHDIAEAYIFNFNYTCETTMEIRNLDGTIVQPISIVSAKRSHQLLMRRMIMITQNLNTLPECRNITFKLFYTENTPTDYQPPGFRDSTNEEKFLMNSTDEQQILRLAGGSMNAGFHSVGVVISTVEERDNFPAVKGILPPEIVNSNSKNVEEDINQPIVIDQDIVEKSYLPKSELVAKHTLKRDDRHWSRRSEDLMRLRGMLKAPGDDQELLATQPLVDDATPPLQQIQSPRVPLSIIDVNQRASLNPKNISATGLEVADSLTIHSAPMTQIFKKNQKLQLTLEKSRQLMSTLKKKKRRLSKTGVYCACLDPATDGDMCESWVHVWCYGYHSGEDERIPDQHICYDCLLEKSEVKTLHSLCDLAVFRRSLKILWEEGFPKTNKAFSDRLSCDLEVLTQILNRLEREGFIENQYPKAARGSQSRRVAKPNTKVIKTSKAQQKLDFYFDPTLLIHHCFVQRQMEESILKKESIAVPRESYLHTDLSVPAPPEAGGDTTEDDEDDLSQEHPPSKKRTHSNGSFTQRPEKKMKSSRAVREVQVIDDEREYY